MVTWDEIDDLVQDAEKYSTDLGEKIKATIIRILEEGIQTDDYMVLKIKIPIDVFENMMDIIYITVDALEKDLKQINEHIEVEWE